MQWGNSQGFSRACLELQELQEHCDINQRDSKTVFTSFLHHESLWSLTQPTQEPVWGLQTCFAVVLSFWGQHTSPQKTSSASLVLVWPVIPPLGVILPSWPPWPPHLFPGQTFSLPLFPLQTFSPQSSAHDIWIWLRTLSGTTPYLICPSFSSALHSPVRWSSGSIQTQLFGDDSLSGQLWEMHAEAGTRIHLRPCDIWGTM